MFGWEFPPYISGGLGTACYGLTKGLTGNKGVDLTFVIPSSKEVKAPENMEIIGADSVSILDAGNVRQGKPYDHLNLIKIHSNLIPYITPKEYQNIQDQKIGFPYEPIQTDENGFVNFTGKYGTKLFDEIKYYSAVAEAIAVEHDFDVIHAHDWLTFQAGIVAKEISGKPLILHIHSTELDRSAGNYNRDIFELEKLGMEVADKIITVSQRTAQIVTEQYKQPAEKITTIYNATETIAQVPIKKTGKRYPEKTVTFLGRITAQKGPEFFVEAAEIILKKIKNVRFVMAGSGNLWHEMIDLVATKKISDKFHFAGFLEGQEVNDLLSMSDVYVMPSTSEPFGISTLEAIQAGVPVIISKQSGVSEVVTNSFQVDYWNTEDLADKIHAVLTNPALAKSIRENAKKEIDNLTWNSVAKEVKQVYENTIATSKSKKLTQLNA